jgi:hypothetical protein
MRQTARHGESPQPCRRARLWESEETMRSSEEAADRMPGESAQGTAAQIGGVERYEVRVFEVPS